MIGANFSMMSYASSSVGLTCCLLHCKMVHVPKTAAMAHLPGGKRCFGAVPHTLQRLLIDMFLAAVFLRRPPSLSQMSGCSATVCSTFRTLCGEGGMDPPPVSAGDVPLGAALLPFVAVGGLRNFAGSSACEMCPRFAVMSSWSSLNSGRVPFGSDIWPTAKCLDCKSMIQRIDAMVVFVMVLCALLL